jgi:uncharacterized membrane protein
MSRDIAANFTATERHHLPAVRRISFRDLREALALGLDDFYAKPSHVLFLGILYPVVGLLIGRLTFGYDILPMLFPLISGFSLLGPLVAIGFYELSRRREQGLDASWWQVLGILDARSLWSILALGLVLMIIFIAWLAQPTELAGFRGAGAHHTGGLADDRHRQSGGIRVRGGGVCYQRGLVSAATGP